MPCLKWWAEVMKWEQGSGLKANLQSFIFWSIFPVIQWEISNYCFFFQIFHILQWEYCIVLFWQCSMLSKGNFEGRGAWTDIGTYGCVDLHKFTPISYRISALWGRWPEKYVFFLSFSFYSGGNHSFVNMHIIIIIFHQQPVACHFVFSLWWSKLTIINLHCSTTEVSESGADSFEM